jgi:tRNA dimethylallyltransferase
MAGSCAVSPGCVIAVVGPTATGKSDLAVALAMRLGGEAINADAMQLYRGMDIGTAKPSRAEQVRLPHHLLDVVEPSRQFSAGDFVRRADGLVADIRARGRVPLVSGGTGFYLRTFLYGMPESPPSNLEVRRRLQDLERGKGTPWLHELLSSRDPEAARRIPANDRHRVLRALEVLETTGRSVYSFAWPSSPRKDHEFLVIGLDRPRDDLYRRIEARVDGMFQAGLVEEVKRLLEAGFGPRDPGMRGIGYREFLAMRKGCLRFREVREMIKADSRRYAKRQMTFLRAIPEVQWFDAREPAAAREAIAAFLGMELPVPP